MINTFWTLIEDEYYRVHDKVLKHAPMNPNTNNIDISQESIIQVISVDKLALVNKILGSNFKVDDF